MSNKRQEASGLLSLFELRRDLSRCATIRNEQDYSKEQPQHPDWPKEPQEHYGDEWLYWNYLLVDNDLSFHKELFPSFEELLCHLREHPEINTREKYIAYSRTHFFGPLDPEAFYESDWPGWEALFDLAGQMQIMDKSPCIFYSPHLFDRKPSKKIWHKPEWPASKA